MDAARFIQLYEGNLIPLRTVLACLTWVLYDYFLTIEDEVRYIWTQKRCFGKFMFFWIRYYTIFLLVFDVAQIHVFALPGVTSDIVCLAINPTTRIIGAISLWSVEIIMQLRIYALFQSNKKVAAVNGILFLASIAAFLYVLIHNVTRTKALLADAVHLPLPGCPSVHLSTEWAQWVPATGYEGVLFCFAVYKAVTEAAQTFMHEKRVSLYSILIRDNLLYFFSISFILVFNNLMAVGITKIPWFSFGDKFIHFSPFHAAVGILTVRMLLNLRKATAHDVYTIGLTDIHIEGLQHDAHKEVTPTPAALSALRFTGSPSSTYATTHPMKDGTVGPDDPLLSRSSD
ncbi:hypothetical protein EYR40_010275 [Pleurotus pulmonarius]|nr:hypothetical protein EYR36_010333 [Pleurotus pulmonarius]KAF4588721.1 hypothetical protein EYR40_010275 [Pleurotus pulmonarius]